MEDTDSLERVTLISLVSEFDQGRPEGHFFQGGAVFQGHLVPGQFINSTGWEILIKWMNNSPLEVLLE